MMDKGFKRSLSREQVDILAHIAMAPRYLKKHAEWLKSSGILNRRVGYHIGEQERIYVDMITAVHASEFEDYMVIEWCGFLHNLPDFDAVAYWFRFDHVNPPWWANRRWEED